MHLQNQASWASLSPKALQEFPSQNQLHVGRSRTQTRLCLPPFSGYKEKKPLPLLHILICLQSGKLRDSPLSRPSKNNSKPGTRLKDGGTGSDFPWDQHHNGGIGCTSRGISTTRTPPAATAAGLRGRRILHHISPCLKGLGKNKPPLILKHFTQ